MSNSNNKEWQIVAAFSSAVVPEQVIQDSNIKELVSAMMASRQEVQEDEQRLASARRAQKEGNFISNWWHDRADKVEDAQISLQRSIGRLSEKSSQLLIVNTAISKVLADQQQVLLEQQNLLKAQAEELAEQNLTILEQQKRLEAQQREINAVNQGLLEVSNLSAEQAKMLAGCVQTVTQAEARIGEGFTRLSDSVDARLAAAEQRASVRLEAATVQVNSLQESVGSALAAQTRQRAEDQAAHAEALAALRQEMASAASSLRTALESAERQAASDAADLRTAVAGVKRLALLGLGGGVAALGWLAVRAFA